MLGKDAYNNTAHHADREKFVKGLLMFIFNNRCNAVIILSKYDVNGIELRRSKNSSRVWSSSEYRSLQPVDSTT